MADGGQANELVDHEPAVGKGAGRDGQKLARALHQPVLDQIIDLAPHRFTRDAGGIGDRTDVGPQGRQGVQVTGQDLLGRQIGEAAGHGAAKHYD